MQKLILKQEVDGLGEPGDVVEVREGYARNYLVPRGYAIGWTRGAQREVDSIRRARTAREVRDADHAKEIRDQLKSVAVRVSARAGEGGRLFGSITTAEVADAVVAAGGPKLDRRRLQLPGHVKSVGTYDVVIKLHPEVEASFKLNVVPAK